MKTIRLKVVCAALMLLTGAAHSQQTTSTQYFYRADGQLSKLLDPLNQSTIYTYDGLGRLTGIERQVNGLARTERFEYNVEDQLVLVTDMKGSTIRFSVDGFGNQLQVVSPDTGTTTNTYDAANNLLTTTDAKSQVTQFQYDLLNRRTSIICQGGVTTDFTYDQGENAIGRLSLISSPAGTIAYSYNLHGEVVKDVRALGTKVFTAEYQYDDFGRLIGLIYPSGRVVSYTLDTQGRVIAINTTKNGATENVVTNVSYQPFGGIASILFSNGRTYTRAHDLDGRVTSYSLSNTETLLNYDAGSHITSVSTIPVSATMTYAYDSAGRLDKYLTGANGTAYAYDFNGNRTSKTVNASVTNLSYGAASNRLTALSGATTSPVITDANGSILSKMNTTYSYDTCGRLSQASTSGGTTKYVVNGLGQRVSKTVGAMTTYYHYGSRGKLIGESTGAVLVDYVYLGDTPVAVYK